jgi:hypothetical protein
MTQRNNYAARMDLKRQLQVAAGPVSDRFPDVDGIVIQMTYFRKGLNPILMQRRVNVFPTTYAYFNMACMISGCTDGGFDLTPVIAGMVKEHKRLGKGSLACCGKIGDIASDHADIAYEITIEFNKGAPAD